MTSREIYFKALLTTNMPLGRLYYTYKNVYGVIKLGSSLVIEFSTDKEIVTCSLIKMQNIESINGFMFWNISTEGENWFDINKSELSNILTNIIFNQK